MEGENRMSERATLIILAGGESKRMGYPKHLLSVPGGTIIDSLHERLSGLFLETLVVGREVYFARGGLRTVEDVRKSHSPLVGIYSGLCAAVTDLAFVVACDMPFVKPRLVRYLLSRAGEVDVVVPIVNGYYEPLCAAYRKTALASIREGLDWGILKITAIYEYLRVRISDRIVRQIDPELSSFVNLNTPQELKLLSGL
jgi:molybdopterin-guanine dinucleotide biosynthesis protein A